VTGERQEGLSLNLIREDHVNRYQLVVEYLSGKTLSTGIDCFCGNGYGSRILADAFPKVNIDAYDGSRSAIRTAKEVYRKKNIKFAPKMYPFDIKENYYDFAVSLESIEHTDMYENLLANLISSLKPEGHLFISVPNEDKIPYQLNKNPYHVKHFTRSEIEDLVHSGGGKIIDYYGQDTYRVVDKTIKKLLPRDEMGLHKNHDGQFLLFVIEKA